MLKRLDVTRQDTDDINELLSQLSGCKPAEHCYSDPFPAVEMEKLDPSEYARSRNFLDGGVTRLSPFIRHGTITLNEVRNAALLAVDEAKEAEKLIQELAWRDYWQRLYAAEPDAMWQDREPYKTGFSPNDYSADMPEDILDGETGQAAIDCLITELKKTGYLHNHARMYLAAYIVHWRRVKWQVGAKWFLWHLIDGDLASNNFSWQWVASTFANKPWFYNLENLQKYCGDKVNTSASDNRAFDHSYEELDLILFPNRRRDHA